MTTTIDETNDGFAHVLTPRRYRLLKRLVAAETGLPELAGVWRSKQEATAATPLPTGFPFADRLAVVGYTAVEDVRGADANELEHYVSLRPSEARSVVAAIAAL